MTKNRYAAYGGIVAAIIVVATFFAFTKANPFADPFEVRAAFRTANDLRPGSQVRIAGITVGKVKEIEGLGEGRSGALVTIEVQKRGLPLHKDTTMKVRPRIFLEGNFFVDVSPGSPSAPLLEDGDMVPVTQTAAPVGFGQLLEALQSDTREDLKTFLREYGRGVEGEGARGFNRSIRWWKPAYRESAVVNDALRGRNGDDLHKYVAGARRVAAGWTAARARCSRSSPTSPSPPGPSPASRRTSPRRSASCRPRCAPGAVRSARSTRPCRRCAA
jgi:hypothetical protein